MHKEPACVVEAKDLFNTYAEELYGDSAKSTDEGKPITEDLESTVASELLALQKPSDVALFQNIKIDTRCVLFLKTKEPIEPISFVRRICQDASEHSAKKHTRFIKRLTPMTRMGKASEAGLEQVAKVVLAPDFHGEEASPKKFAIRVTTRDNNLLKRDDVINQIARLVGTLHSVDLKHYDLLILVEIYRNVLGMSVVGNDYEKLKRYNLSELYTPIPKAGINTDADDVH